MSDENTAVAAAIAAGTVAITAILLTLQRRGSITRDDYRVAADEVADILKLFDSRTEQIVVAAMAGHIRSFLRLDVGDSAH